MLTPPSPDELARREIATLRYQFPYMERGTKRPDPPQLAHATVRAAVDDARIDTSNAERARFLVSLLVDALSPTNALAGNPAALKKLVETGGLSVLQGLENFIGDLVRNGGLPAQVDARNFAVGKNLATTPGAVVLRTEVLRRGAELFINERLKYIGGGEASDLDHQRFL